MENFPGPAHSAAFADRSGRSGCSRKRAQRDERAVENGKMLWETTAATAFQGAWAYLKGSADLAAYDAPAQLLPTERRHIRGTQRISAVQGC